MRGSLYIKDLVQTDDVLVCDLAHDVDLAGNLGNVLHFRLVNRLDGNLHGNSGVVGRVFLCTLEHDRIIARPQLRSKAVLLLDLRRFYRTV